MIHRVQILLTPLISPLLMFVLLSGCATGHSSPDILHGIVFSSGGQALFGAEVRVTDRRGEHHQARADIHGRFRISGIMTGPVVVTVLHQTHEPLQQEVMVADRTQVLYLRLTSWRHLLEAWQASLEQQDISHAETLLIRLHTAGCPAPIFRHAEHIQQLYRKQTGHP
ncbi:carboxypeptidase-like regulatory domain-containing protein [Spirochaeta africana]|uniref:Carboxypeptidase regulatory-like domain-containing protein n=1 Tax=Spirochaeta africana (strain ATCC 700263 / DSM 8902 / Z-7692) TaxID=889378 RepID=H9UK44_SPIAZ|nr:carboxypeptidase-like regulatory domain-containing protein [Spirochaeta africana]AFG37887.1 hypothetical protein Spiaf_1830 [Spirochaeta africana DSM 8902]